MSELNMWATVALYVSLAILGGVSLYRWHTDPSYRNFTLIDLVSDGGRISSRKFMEFGAWVVVTAHVVVQVIKGTLNNETIVIYLGAFVAARSVGQLINARSDVEVRKASIAKGHPQQAERRFEARSDRADELTVEQEDSLREQERARFKK